MSATLSESNHVAVKSNPHPLRIAVVVCTYNRPHGLERVLRSLARLRTPDVAIVELVIVDNSADGNARGLIETMLGELPYAMQYIHEPEPGISAARNAALEWILLQRFDFMASIDDDMHADPDWLAELMTVAVESSAHAVIGCTLFDYVGAQSWWVDEAYRLDDRGPGDRDPIDQGHTGGSLVRLDLPISRNMRFELNLGRSGGEDTLFFDEIIRHGGRMLYAGKAISHEVLGPDRARVRWWLRRWYRTGNTTGLVALTADKNARARVAVDGVVRMSAGFVGTLVSLPWLLRRRAVGMRAVRMLCRGAGYIAAALGSRYDEYGRGDRGE